MSSQALPVRRVSPKELSLLFAIGASALLVPVFLVQHFTAHTLPVIQQQAECISDQFVRNGFKITSTRVLRTEGLVEGYQAATGRVVVSYGAAGEPNVTMEMQTIDKTSALRPLIAGIAGACDSKALHIE